MPTINPTIPPNTRAVGGPDPAPDMNLVSSALTTIVEAVNTRLEIGSNAWLIANVNNIAYTSVTRNSNQAATSANVVWPDGTAGVYTADVLSTAFPGAVDAYHVTYIGATTKTVTQATVTRNSAGAVTAQPALTVS